MFYNLNNLLLGIDALVMNLKDLTLSLSLIVGIALVCNGLGVSSNRSKY
jgi:hypothetical protein